MGVNVWTTGSVALWARLGAVSVVGDTRGGGAELPMFNLLVMLLSFFKNASSAGNLDRMDLISMEGEADEVGWAVLVVGVDAMDAFDVVVVVVVVEGGKEDDEEAWLAAAAAAADFVSVCI